MRLYCATTNPGKLREFEADPIPGLKEIPPVEETGATFEDNAILKAEYYSRFVPQDAYVFVDDSGLSVDALQGAPGVYSARFAGPGASDDDNNRLLVEKLRGIADRTARYVCVIALAKAGTLVATFRGEVQGQILDAPRGGGGFGYDPYFYYPPFNRTFAEISQAEKQTVSHRGAALHKMREYLSADSHGA